MRNIQMSGIQEHRMKFKVLTGDGRETFIGAENARQLVVSIRISSESEKPEAKGAAYIFEGDLFTEFQSWDIASVGVGEFIKIEVIESGGETKPTEVEFSTAY